MTSFAGDVDWNEYEYNISIRLIQESKRSEADYIFLFACGAFIGLADPCDSLVLMLATHLISLENRSDGCLRGYYGRGIAQV